MFALKYVGEFHIDSNSPVPKRQTAAQPGNILLLNQCTDSTEVHDI